MARQYIKTKVCGCVIKAISDGVKNTTDGKMYMLGGHDHLIICDICNSAVHFTCYGSELLNYEP